MGRRFLEVLIVILSFAILLSLFVNTSLSVWSSPSKQFNVTPDNIWLNWTNTPNQFQTNVTVGINTSFNNIIVEIVNDTTQIIPYYSQPPRYTYCSGLRLLVQNASGYYSTVGPLTAGSTSNISFIHSYFDCYPGRYSGNLTIKNVTTENLTINVTVDIPISSGNNADLLTTGVGSFGGGTTKLPSNATIYHSYYFNTSTIPNATSVAINLTGWSSQLDADIFLFDNSGSLKAKSINKTATSEWLEYNYLPTNPAMWEIRIYGNTTTSSGILYGGNIMFSTLNATNTSDNYKQISSIDFGVMNVTTSINFKNITLRNEGNISLTNVAETKEFYNVKRFSGSGIQNFTFLVPDSSITSKVKVSLNWTGGSNYSFNLYDRNDVLLASSANKYVYANSSKAMQEEYNETTTPSTVALWKVEVKDSTAFSSPYTLNVYMYPTGTWITTNYTTSMTFVNRSNFTDVHINITVPTSALNGSYEGYVQYLDDRNAGIRIPIKVDVTTPMLVVNNTMFSITPRVDENYGSTLSRFLIFNISNPGFYSSTLTFTSSSNLTCGSGACVGTGWNASFSYNATNSSIISNGFMVVNVSVKFNSSISTGLYEGLIFINATNETSNLTSRPYTNFTINLKLNLTNLLESRISSSTTQDGDEVVGNATGSIVSENVTHKVKIFYINGTETEVGNTLNTSNFTVWLVERNVSYRIPSVGGLSLYNHTTPLYDLGYYNINSTIPANQPGGRYEVWVSASWTRSDGNPFIANGTNRSTLIINNTGLRMTAIGSTSISVNKDADAYFNVSIDNFGPLAAVIPSTSINFITGCTYATAYATDVFGTYYGGSGIAVSASVSTYNFSMPAYNYSSGWVRWRIHGNNNGTCPSANVEGGSLWFGGIPVSITVSVPSEEEGGLLPNYTAPTYVANLAFTKAESPILVQQNSSNSTIVEVKNTGNVSQNITFSILNISSSWYGINATTASLAVNRTAGFLVTFTVGNEEIKDYSGSFKAESVNKTITSVFALRVLPNEANKTYTNNTLATYKQNMTDLSTKINQSKAQGYDVNLTEVKFLQLKTTIEQAENFIAQGDYFHAYQLLSSIKSLLDQTAEELSKAQKTEEAVRQMISYITYALIAAGIAGAIILAYLFWPTKLGYKPKEKTYVYRPTGKEQIWEKLKEKWESFGKKKKEEKK